MKILNQAKKRFKKAVLFFQKGFTYFFYLLGFEMAPSPKSINVEITWNCNLNCFMCPRHRAQPFEINNKNLPLFEFKQIVKKIPSVKHINIVGDGEPFVNPEFIDMLLYADSKGITTSFNTNGTLLSEENILKLPRTITLIWISIDSPVKETYERIRAGANFDILLDNIDRLSELRKDIQIVFQPAVMKMNMAEMPQMIDIAKKAGASVNFVDLMAFDQELDKQSTHHYQKEYSEMLKKIEKEAKEKGVIVSTRPLSPAKRRCTEPWFHPTISIEGNIYACCYVYAARGDQPSFKEYYLDQGIDVPEAHYKMGNIFKDSFKKIWNGNAYRLLRKEVTKTNNPLSVSSSELKKMREKVSSEKRYSYCAVCLARWKCAC